MATVIRQIGNSYGAIIPAALLKKLNLSTGDKVNIEEDNGKIVITTSKPKYNLKDLIAKCDPSAPIPVELQEWDNADPVGHEIW